MKLHAQNYISPNPQQGKFDELFIEETSFTIEKLRNYMSISFEMYYIKDGARVILDNRSISFYGKAGDAVTSNKLAILSVPNENYDTQVSSVPTTIDITNPASIEYIQQPNPDYNPEDIDSKDYLDTLNPDYSSAAPEFITVDNPDYDTQVAAVPKMVSVPFLEYLYTHEGVLPEVYEVVDWGYPNFQDALLYFNGGDRNNPDITIENPFAKGWMKNNIIMNGEPIGTQFEFID